MKRLCFLLAVLLLTSIGTCPSALAVSYEFTNSNPNVNSELNRGNAADYAVDFARKPGNTDDYASYGSGTLGGDCTNFVSQVLRGGGMNFHGTKGSNIFTQDWYYYGPNIPPATQPRTSTWTGAHEFRKHWGTVDGVGGKKAYQMVKYTNLEASNNFDSIYTELWPGDIIQFTDANGLTGHSIVIWKYGMVDGVKTMNYAQHSTDNGTWDWALDLRTRLSNNKNNPGFTYTLKMRNGS
ncbi:amidase domain-containing protein [Desulfosporosinus meridiei]|uniref:Putative amidase domain-containing protein n=1 Tax=Desulfosporosinus meridiei (strain ATCC BAA-275 / DSM 13257 / KCTC 12902 / NCIMB 13706 / S10) TaxID=768704 RepID=J7IT88_DESMD|nr:amidase domain-containing protein [Desulfosporosinus meridiei]AFQ43379.1 hypothetical protein Desmer_1379 [Desulfosporosinus meridiei DSM 13257]